MNPLLTKIIPLIPAILKKKRSWVAVVALLGAGYFATGSLSSGVDWLWKEPRDLLVDRVEAARDSQHDAAEEYQDAYTAC